MRPLRSTRASWSGSTSRGSVAIGLGLFDMITAGDFQSAQILGCWPCAAGEQSPTRISLALT